MRSLSKESASITHLLHAYNNGDESAMNRMLPMVYDELCVIAHQYIRQERGGHTLDTQGLVHDAYIRLLGGADIEWQNRKHLYVIFARTMRRLLCDYARKFRSEKRGGGVAFLTVTSLSDLYSGDPKAGEDHISLILSVDKALEHLENHDPLLAQIVELRFYHGLTIAEVAKIVGRSTRSVKRDWKVARVLLAKYLGKEEV